MNDVADLMELSSEQVAYPSESRRGSQIFSEHSTKTFIERAKKQPFHLIRTAEYEFGGYFFGIIDFRKFLSVLFDDYI